MASLYIRDIDDNLLWELRQKAASEHLTLKELVVPALEMLAKSKPALKGKP